MSEQQETGSVLNEERPVIDMQYLQDGTATPGTREHLYDTDWVTVHVLRSLTVATLLGPICDKDACTDERMVRYTKQLYDILTKEMIDRVFPRRMVLRQTPQHTGKNPQDISGLLHQHELDLDIDVRIAMALRAGTTPSTRVRDRLMMLLPHGTTALDSVPSQRITGPDDTVVGTAIVGAKVKGTPLNDRVYVVGPDPILATGGTLCKYMHEYLACFGEKPDAFVFLNQIAAPEGIRRIQDFAAERQVNVVVITCRLDRQKSPDEVLCRVEPLGTSDFERGLDEKCYVCPGIGDAGSKLCGTVGTELYLGSGSERP